MAYNPMYNTCKIIGQGRYIVYTMVTQKYAIKSHISVLH